MNMFYELHKEKKLSTILVTHSMEDAARFADQIIIMHKGEVYKKGTPEEIFTSPEGLLELGLDVPEVIRFQKNFEKTCQVKLDRICLTTEQLAEAVTECLKRGVPK
jgi:energy-coupling factor transport system ATP-binding protein